MTLPLWPATPLPDLPYQWKAVRRVKRGGPFGGDRWLTRADNRFPLMSVALTYFFDNNTDLETIYNFWDSVGGANGIFDFADLTIWDESPGGLLWAKMFAGQILAATLDYDLPIKTTTGTGFVVKIDGVTKTVQRITTPGTEDGSSDVYLYPAGGGNGRDKAHTRVQQTVGQILTVTGQGQRIQQTRVLEEELPIVWSELTNFTLGPVTLLEVR